MRRNRYDERVKRWVVALCAVTMLAGSAITVNAACSGWTVCDQSDPYCATVGCNEDRALWMYIDYKHERRCVSEYGTVYYEYKTTSSNPGCC